MKINDKDIRTCVQRDVTEVLVFYRDEPLVANEGMGLVVTWMTTKQIRQFRQQAAVGLR